MQRPDRAGVDHVLRLYENREELVRSAVEFVAEGLHRGERVLALLTEDRWKGVFDGLEILGVPHGRAAQSGRFILIDADSMLNDIVVDGVFDRSRFESRWEPLLDPPNRPQRIYGEMTAMLAALDNLAAALAVEEVLQEFVHELQISLLCAVNVSDFSTPAARDNLRRLREQHENFTTRYREHG